MLHYGNLRQGLILKEIHRVRIELEFNQPQWLKPHIGFNTQKKNRSRKNWRQRWKCVVQINEQCCIW